MERLQALVAAVGKDRLVVDVRCALDLSGFFGGRLTERSCRKRGDGWFVAMNKWQDLTDMEVSKGLLYGHL